MTDKYILNCLKEYKIPFTSTPYKVNFIQSREYSPKERSDIIIEINKILNKCAIKKCEECDDQFLSDFFLVPKPDRSKRFILNLKGLNKFIVPPHFKLENIYAALNLISQDDF